MMRRSISRRLLVTLGVVSIAFGLPFVPAAAVPSQPSAAVVPPAAVAPAAVAPAAVPTAAGAFVSLDPSRILDTRTGNGAGGPVAAHGVVTLQVGGRGGVPRTGVSAVVLNVTVTGPTQYGDISTWAAGAPRPTVSSLNFVRGQTIANLVVVPIGAGGAVQLANNSAGSVQLVADVSGYYIGGSPAAAGTFTALTPVRLLDSRSGNGAAGPIRPQSEIALQVGGRGGVPRSGVSAVVMNVTVTSPTQSGIITAWADGTQRPAVSNLNFVRNQTIPNLVVVPVGANGVVRLANGSAGSVQLIGDVSGYFLGGTPTVPGAYRALAPTRILDTRTTVGGLRGAVPAGRSIPVTVEGAATIPTFGVSAVVMNVTVTEPSRPGNITAFPDGTARPTASNLNFVAGQTIPNLTMVRVGANGKVALANVSTGFVELVADVSGYYLTGEAPQPGPVRSWGSNTYPSTGVLGNNTTVKSLVPTSVVNLTGVKALAGGWGMMLALRSDGTVWAWGDARNGKLGNGASSGSSSVPVRVTGLTDVVSIGAGPYNGYAIRSDGTAWSWGYGGYRALGTGSTEDSSVPARITTLSNVVSITGGTYNAYAAKSDGTVWSWGSSGNGALGARVNSTAVPVQVPGLSGVVSVAACESTGYALKSNGTVWAWGYGGYGGLGNGTTSSSQYDPVQTIGLTGVKKISGSWYTAYALKTDGSVWSWGRNQYGQVGNGSTNNSSAPVQVSGLSGVLDIAAGASAAYAIVGDRTVRAWGYGRTGALGNGGQADSTVPVAVSGLYGAFAVGGADQAGFAVMGN
jgi:alpha-tubulin suppressor-like RCC1 family protein